MAFEEQFRIKDGQAVNEAGVVSTQKQLEQSGIDFSKIQNLTESPFTVEAPKSVERGIIGSDKEEERLRDGIKRIDEMGARRGYEDDPRYQIGENGLVSTPNELVQEIEKKKKSQLDAGGLEKDEFEELVGEGERANYTYDPETGIYSPTAPQDPFISEFQSITQDINNNLQSRQDLLTKMMDNATEEEKVLLKGINAKYDERRDKMEEINRRRLKREQTRQIRYGTARYSPQTAEDIFDAEEDAGLDRLNQIEAERNQAIAAAKQAIKTEKYDILSKQLDVLDKKDKQRLNTLKTLNKIALDRAKETRAVAQFEMDVEKFDFEKIKFVEEQRAKAMEEERKTLEFAADMDERQRDAYSFMLEQVDGQRFEDLDPITQDLLISRAESIGVSEGMLQSSMDVQAEKIEREERISLLNEALKRKELSKPINYDRDIIDRMVEVDGRLEKHQFLVNGQTGETIRDLGIIEAPIDPNALDPVTKRQLQEGVDSSRVLVGLVNKYKKLVEKHGYTVGFGWKQDKGTMKTLRGMMIAEYKKAETLGTLDQGVLDLMDAILGDEPRYGVSANIFGGKTDEIMASINQFQETTYQKLNRDELRLGDTVTLRPEDEIREEDVNEVDLIWSFDDFDIEYNMPETTSSFNPDDYIY